MSRFLAENLTHFFGGKSNSDSGGGSNLVKFYSFLRFLIALPRWNPTFGPTATPLKGVAGTKQNPKGFCLSRSKAGTTCSF